MSPVKLFHWILSLSAEGKTLFLNTFALSKLKVDEMLSSVTFRYSLIGSCNPAQVFAA